MSLDSAAWPKVRLGYVVREMGGSTPSKDRPDFWGGAVPWVSPKDMKVERMSDSIDHVTEAAVAGTSLREVPVGSVLLVVRGMILAHTVPVALTDAPITVNQDMKALLPGSKLSGLYLRYSLQAHQALLLALVEEAGHGTRCLRSEQWRKFEVPVPPLPTQKAIAAFLDRKTAAIDALIAKKRRLLDLLAEKRAALINQAVTKGLDPSVPMKDSGIPWIGEIPAHWSVSRLSFRYSQQLGKMLNPEAAEGPDLAPYLANKDVQWDYVRVDDLSEMSFSANERVKYGLREGDLVVCEGGEAGRTAVWRGELAECYFQKAIHRLRPYNSECDHPRFHYYSMFAAKTVGVFEEGGNKATIGHLTGEALRAHRFPWPPMSEQVEIAAHLDGRIRHLDCLTTTIQRHVERLQEYRQALITAAVTGQLDITGEAAP